MNVSWTSKYALCALLFVGGTAHAQTAEEAPPPLDGTSATTGSAASTPTSAEVQAATEAADAEAAAAAEAAEAAAEARAEEVRAAEAEAAEAVEQTQAAEERAAQAAAEAEAAREAAAQAEAAAAAADTEAAQAEAEAEAARLEALARRDEAMAAQQEAAAEAAAARAEAAEQRAAAERALAAAEAADERAQAADRAARQAAAAAGAAGAAAVGQEDAGEYEGQLVGALGVTGSVSLTTLANVPGQPRGLSANLSAAIDGVLDYFKGDHELRNSLTLTLGIVRSASDEVWVKTNDMLRIQSGYYYTVTDWFGPFAELAFKTSLAPLRIRRPSDETLFCDSSIDRADCVETNAIAQTDNFRATSGFEPIEFNERFGLYVRPLDRQYFRLAIRTGFAAQQFYVTSDAYLETGRSAVGDVISLQQLDDYGLFGFLADMQIRGATTNERVLYGVNGSLLYPFVDTTSDQLDALGISPLQTELSAFVTMKITSWAGLDLRASAARIPQVTGDEWQTSLQALLTFNYAIVGDIEEARDSAATLRYSDLGEAE